MTALDNWLKEYFSGGDGDASTILARSQKQELQKIIENLLKAIDCEDVQLEDLSKFCQVVDKCSTNATATFAQGQALSLDEFLTKLLDFSVCMAIMNRTVHTALRDETNLLSTLTSSLSGKYREEDQTKILMVLETLSRELNISWTAPYVAMLIKHIFSVLLSTNSSSEAFLFGLRIMNNLTFHNRNCLNIALKDDKYKDVVKVLLQVFSDGSPIKEINALAMHYCLTMDQTLTLKMENVMNNIKETFLNLHLKFANGSTSIHTIHSVVGSIYHMGLCLRSLLTQAFKTWSEESDDLSEEMNERNRKLVNMLQQTMTIIFQTFFSKCIPLLGSSKGQLVLEHLLQLLVAFCPVGIPEGVFAKLWDCFIKSLNELSVVASKTSKTQIVVLESHLHIIDILLNLGASTQFPAESFTSALKTCQLLVSTSTDDLTRNILTIRLINRLNTLACQQNKKENIFLKLVSEETLSQLLSLLLARETEESLFPDVHMSTCVIEALNVLSKLSKNPRVLIESLEKEATWIHVANCFINGDEELIIQAITLMSDVGFSKKCRAGISKKLSTMRDFPSTPKSLPASPEKPNLSSYSAQMGIARLNHNLEMFAELKKEGSDPGFDELLTWYKLKEEMFEMEVTSMNDHIFHLNRTISHLKTLLDKQSELATKRAASAATMTINCNDLKKQLEITKEKKCLLETKHAKALVALRGQLNYQEELFKSKSERLTLVEQQLQEMKEKCSRLEAGQEEALASSQKVTAEKRKLQEKLEGIEKENKCSRQKISSLETEYKKSEEARKATEALLEAERRKTEIIQQVLGNRLN